MECGISPERFDNYSIAEIQEIIAAYNRQREQRAKESISMNFVLAEVIALNICCGLTGKGETPKAWDYYPELFHEEEMTYQKEKEAREWQEYKEDRKRYIEEYNKRRDQ